MLSGVAEACDEAGVALVLIPRGTRRRHGPRHRALGRRRRVRRPLRRPRRRAPHDRRGAPPADRRARRPRRARTSRRSASTRRAAPTPPPTTSSSSATAAWPSSPSAAHDVGTVNTVTDAPPRRLPRGRRRARPRPGRRRRSSTGFAYDRAATTAVARELLAAPTARPAVLAMSDEMAVGRHRRRPRARPARPRGPVGRRLRRHRHGGDAPTPPLTTVRQPHADKGAAAVRMLLADGAGPREICVPRRARRARLDRSRAGAPSAISRRRRRTARPRR